jgi:hypothetical protein
MYLWFILWMPVSGCGSTATTWRHAQLYLDALYKVHVAGVLHRNPQTSLGSASLLYPVQVKEQRSRMSECSTRRRKETREKEEEETNQHIGIELRDQRLAVML